MNVLLLSMPDSFEHMPPSSSACPMARCRRSRATWIRIIASWSPISFWPSRGWSRLSNACARVRARCRRPLSHDLSAGNRASRSRGCAASAPGTRIVVGGYDPSLAPEAYEPCAEVEFLVRGEGEQTFSELLRALEPAAPFRRSPGLSRPRAVWFHGPTARSRA